MRSRVGSGRLFGVQSGNGPALLLVHGLAGSYRIFDPLVPLLEDHFTVTRVDLLGYGHSPKPRITYDPATHVEAIHDAVTHFALPKPFVIVGLSMGVDLVLEYARRWPDELNGLVGIGLCYYQDEVAARQGLQQNFWTSTTVNHPLLSRVIIPPLWWIGRHVEAISRQFSSIYTPEMANDALLNKHFAFQSSMWNTMVHNPIGPLLAASSELPRLFIQGSEDKWSSLEDLKSSLHHFPRTALQVLEGVAHNAVVLEPVHVAQAIIAFASAPQVNLH